MPYHCKSCPKGSRCVSCRDRAAQNKRACRLQRIRPDLYLLPDDGIIDGIAVDIASHGTRQVRMTAEERELAGIVILANGGNVRDLLDWLALPSLTAAYVLYHRIAVSARRVALLLPALVM